MVRVQAADQRAAVRQALSNLSGISADHELVTLLSERRPGLGKLKMRVVLALVRAT